MSNQHVDDHYGYGKLLAAIRAGLQRLGKTPQTATIDDLAPADEFHIGGRQASLEFIDQLKLERGNHTLDVGCGLGGTARFIASHYGCRVTGIDLTTEFVKTGRELCDWVGLADRVVLHQGDALAMPFAEASFDAATMLHVGMNIPDKADLFNQVAHVLKRGSIFGIYDIMKMSDENLDYPLPWASDLTVNSLGTMEQYSQALTSAGFEILAYRDRRAFAMEFFDEARRKAAQREGPPPLGVHIAMGGDAPTKIKNMVDSLVAGSTAPMEIITRKES